MADGTNAAEPQAAQDAAGAQEPAEATDWKALARKWEARAKENSDAAEKLAQLEEEGKTELQKAADKAAKAEAKLAAIEAERQQAAWAAEVAEATGIPAGVLRGATKDELEAHAAQLAKLTAPLASPTVPDKGGEPAGEPPAKDPLRELLESRR